MSSLDYKISFCTVCMNRLHHLEQTLPKNIQSNKYKNIEFVILDYNSSDSLESYIKDNYAKEIKEKSIVYYKTTTPKYFHRSHSRNLVYKLATGDIICNVDADNFTGLNFAEYINSQFQERKHIYITSIDTGGPTLAARDALGRICMLREDFINIRGYDEAMSGYGFEDFDIANRLESRGIKRKLIQMETNFLNALSHDNIDRIRNEFVYNNIYKVLVRYLTPSSSDLLFVFKDNKYCRGKIIYNANYTHKEPITELTRVQLKYLFSLYDNLWQIGTWREESENIILETHNLCEILVFNNCDRHYVSPTNEERKIYHIIDNPALLEDTLLNFSELSNRITMEKNKLDHTRMINPSGFGNGTVYKNFDYGFEINI